MPQLHFIVVIPAIVVVLVIVFIVALFCCGYCWQFCFFVFKPNVRCVLLH